MLSRKPAIELPPDAFSKVLKPILIFRLICISNPPVSQPPPQKQKKRNRATTLYFIKETPIFDLKRLPNPRRIIHCITNQFSLLSNL